METKTRASVVWSEIPVTDLTAATAFYGAIMGPKPVRQMMGPNEVAVLAGSAADGGAHLCKGKPAVDGSGPILHLACEGPLEQAMARCRDAGGQVLSEPIPIPEGRFAYARDPDGNAIGLFEAR